MNCVHAIQAWPAGTLLLGRMVAHDFDLNTRTWYFVANGVVALACIAEVCSLTICFSPHPTRPPSVLQNLFPMHGAVLCVRCDGCAVAEIVKSTPALKQGLSKQGCPLMPGPYQEV